MIDYTIYYKNNLPIVGDWTDENWDLFISAYNSSQRVNDVYEKVIAKRKYWLLFEEYTYELNDYPLGNVFAEKARNEADFIMSFFRQEINYNLDKIKICIDMTGFIRPYLIFLIKWLHSEGVRRFDVIYSEPDYYARKEDTLFSDEEVMYVRQVIGFGGNHIPDTSKDIMVIGAGYDHEFITRVAKDKKHTRKIQIYGLPSLLAEFYQENVLRADKAKEYIGSARDEQDNYFAPANDPFVTASVLHEIIGEISWNNITNLYLSPLATKPQVLGFTIFYLTECVGKRASLIFPFCRKYPQETSKGISRIWKYVVQFPD